MVNLANEEFQLKTNLQDVFVSFHWPCTRKRAPCWSYHCNILQGLSSLYGELSEEDQPVNEEAINATS